MAKAGYQGQRIIVKKGQPSSVHRLPDSEQLPHFTYRGLTGYRVTQGEYRIVYAVDEKAKVVKLARIPYRDRDYRELDQISARLSFPAP